MSRGALLHHYPAKIDLIVDAAAQVWRGAIAEVRKLSEALSRGQLDIDAFVEAIWTRVFPTDDVTMTLDLTSAARSDKELYERISIHLQELFEAHDQIAEQAFAKSGLSRDEQRVMVLLTTCVIRGLKLQDPMQPDPAMTQAIRDALKMMLENVLSSAEGSALLPEPAQTRERAAGP